MLYGGTPPWGRPEACSCWKQKLQDRPHDDRFRAPCNSQAHLLLRRNAVAKPSADVALAPAWLEHWAILVRRSQSPSRKPNPQRDTHPARAAASISASRRCPARPAR
jgi:hypothetical protein